MFRIKYFKLPLLCLLFALEACSDGGPSEQELENKFERTADGWVIADVSIEASENIGNEVEPIFYQRFTLDVELTEARYEIIDEMLGQKVIVSGLPTGSKYTLSGTYKARKYNQKWVYDFSSSDGVLEIPGVPFSKIDKYVLANSQKHKALKTEYEKQTIRDGIISRVNRTLSDTHTSADPITINGKTIRLKHNGHRLGFQVSFGSADIENYSSGDATVHLFELEDPSKNTKYNAFYEVSDDYRTIEIMIMGIITYRSGGETKYLNHQIWNLSPYGEMTSGKKNKAETLLLQGYQKIY